MGNDEELIKIKSLVDVEKDFHSFDGVRVSVEERNDEVLGGGGGGSDSGTGGGGGDDIDVNMPLKELSNGKNIGETKLGGEEDCLDDSEIEKPPKEGEYGNNGEIGRIGGVNGDDSLTHKVGFGGDDGINSNSELVGDYGSRGESLMSPSQRGLRSKIKGGGSSNSDVKGDPDMKTVDLSSGVSQRTRNRVVRGKKVDVDEMDVGSNASELDFEGDEEIGFSVGDFVWGKIKSHPCWPGRIYSPSYASEFALKYKHEGRLLVAYFGDGTFAWCDPSQLKPFVENFEEMSKKSSLKSFVHAVDEAVDEFGRVVELKMTSLYAMKGSHSSIPMVVNGGIKHGVHLPLDGVDKFSVDQFEPTIMLGSIRSFARGESMADMLELRVLRSRLSCFYHAKGGYLLPVYYEPMGIEDTVETESSPRGPDDEDWFISPGKRRKEKSMAELLGTETKVLEGNHVGSSKGEMQLRSCKKRRTVTDKDQTARNVEDDDESDISQSGKLASKGRWRMRKDRKARNEEDDEDEDEDDEAYISESGKLSSKGRRRMRQDQMARNEEDDDEDDDETYISQLGKLSSKGRRRMRKDQKAKNEEDDDEDNDEAYISQSGKLSSKGGRRMRRDQKARNEEDDDEAYISQLWKLSSKGGRRTRKDQKARNEGDDDDDYISKSGKLASMGGRRMRKDRRARNEGDDDEDDDEDDDDTYISQLWKLSSKGGRRTRKDQRARNEGDDDDDYISKSGKLASKGGRRTRKDQRARNEGDDDDDDGDDDDDESDISQWGKLASKGVRRTRKIADESQDHIAENSTMTRLSSRKKENLPREKREMGMSLRVESGVTSQEGQERMSSPRERKKSKYLSPPYITLLQKESSSSSPMGSEPGGGLELSDVARMGERITRASGKLLDSTPLKPMKVDDSMKSISSSNKVLCEIRSAALDSICLRKDESFDTIKGFLSSYRNSSYKNGSNYHIYKNFMDDKKKRKRSVSDNKHATALVMEFPPEFTLPSKDDLMKMNSKFGPLDESKSKVVPKSSTAKIVFLKRLDAEAAMDNMKNCSPFGTARVSYRIRHLDASEKKKGKLSETKESKSMDKNPSGVSENEPLAVIFIKQKLEAMTSMLSQTDGKMTEEVKTNLENEVKELLKKVKMMTAAAASSSQ